MLTAPAQNSPPDAMENRALVTLATASARI